MASIKFTAARTLRCKPLTQNTPRIFTSAGRNVGNAAWPRTPQSELAQQPFPLPSNPFYELKHTPPPRSSLPSPSITTDNPFLDLQNALTTHLATHPSSALSPTLPKLFAMLRNYQSDAMHWSRYAHANASKQYTRNLVCEVPGLFNLLLLVWTPGKKSPVHDHADSHCLMKILKGNLTETRFAIPTNSGHDGPLVQTSRKHFKRDQVTYMSDLLGLHEISNPDPTEFAVSLHLYTPPNAALRGCHVYDIKSGDAKHVMQGAYDSARGVVCH